MVTLCYSNLPLSSIIYVTIGDTYLILYIHFFLRPVLFFVVGEGGSTASASYYRSITEEIMFHVTAVLAAGEYVKRVNRPEKNWSKVILKTNLKLVRYT